MNDPAADVQRQDDWEALQAEAAHADRPREVPAELQSAFTSEWLQGLSPQEAAALADRFRDAIRSELISKKRLKGLPPQEAAALVDQISSVISSMVRPVPLDEVTLMTPTGGVIRQKVGSPHSGAQADSAGDGERRLNVRFSPDAYEQVQQMAQRRGKTVSETVREALGLDLWLERQLNAGYSLQLKRKDGAVKTVMTPATK